MADANLDLTPRDHGDEPARPARNKWLPRLVIGGVVAALVFVAFQTLGNASLFFYNVDEAIEQREDLGDRRFRLQGTPIGRAVEFELEGQAAVGFLVSFEGAVTNVVHLGLPAESFQPSVPVVLEGRWQQDFPADAGSQLDAPEAAQADSAWYFESTEMLVKHDNDYRVDNEDRLSDAERGGMLAEQ